MRRVIVATVVAMSMVLAPAALGHPSENRAEQSTFDGPHCHTNLISGKLAFPSHRAHIATGGGESPIFTLAACP